MNKRYIAKKTKKSLTPPLGGWGAGMVVFFLVLITSCVESLDIEQGKVKPKIVLNGIIEADSTITVRISKTYPFTNDYYDNMNGKNISEEDKIIPNLLPDANAKLYVNDEWKGNLQFVKNDSSRFGNGSVFYSDFRPKIGDKIRVEVSASGFENVWAETVIPQPIQINQVDTATFISKDKTGYSDRYVVPNDAKPLNLSLGIEVENQQKDTPGFYSISIYQEWMRYINSYWVEGVGLVYKEKADSVYEKRDLYINIKTEPLFSDKIEDELLRFFLENGNPQNLYFFHDRTFVDKRYRLNVSVWGYYFHEQYNKDYNIKPPIHEEPISIEIASMSRELYQATYPDYSELGYVRYLMTEPKTTFSNVRNGTGIFGSLSKTKKVIEIPGYTGEW